MSETLLKPYCQSVLRIEVPVVVTLGRQRMPIDQILRLVPGVMIQFDKSCESPMSVEIGDQPIATGEVVKTGEKFGIRIAEILQPAERFVRLDKLQTKTKS